MGARAARVQRRGHRRAGPHDRRGRRGVARRARRRGRRLPARARPGDRVASRRGGGRDHEAGPGRAPLRARQGQGERVRLPRRRRPRGRPRAARARRGARGAGRAGRARGAAHRAGSLESARVIPKVLATVLLGGIAAIDATPVVQSLLSQPLVTASLLGLVWGQWLLAVKVGIVLQVFAAGTMPVGSRTPEDYATGGVIGAGTALMLASTTTFSLAHEASAFAGCIVGMASSMAGVPLIKWQRRRNEGLSRWCEEALRRGDLSALGQANVAGVVMAFGVGVVFCAVFLAVAAGLVAPVVHRRSLRAAGGRGI